MGILVMGLLLLAALAIGGWVFWDEARQERDSGRPQMETEVELHRISRNLDVALTKAEIRRDAAELRKQLDDELRGLGRK